MSDSNQMFDAVCTECGQKCQVPFRPTGDKPVYCTNCFAKRQGGRDQRRERGGRKMFSAICAKCGKQCEVPFQPTPGKQIFCNQCFGRGGERGGAGAGNRPDQLQMINSKLDKIINALIVAKIIKPAKEVKPEVKKPEVKKAKPAAKKVAAKKPAGKKKVKK